MRTSCLALLPALALAAGCGGNQGPELAPVKGTVTYKGQPLKQGVISIQPTSGGRPAQGKIVDGQITDVTTHKANDGAPVGPAKVSIQAVEGDGMAAPRKSLVPDKYGDPNKSGLTADIKKGDNNLTFELTD